MWLVAWGTIVLLGGLAALLFFRWASQSEGGYKIRFPHDTCSPVAPQIAFLFVLPVLFVAAVSCLIAALVMRRDRIDRVWLLWLAAGVVLTVDIGADVYWFWAALQATVCN